MTPDKAGPNFMQISPLGCISRLLSWQNMATLPRSVLQDMTLDKTYLTSLRIRLALQDIADTWQTWPRFTWFNPSAVCNWVHLHILFVLLYSVSCLCVILLCITVCHSVNVTSILFFCVWTSFNCNNYFMYVLSVIFWCYQWHQSHC